MDDRLKKMWDHKAAYLRNEENLSSADLYFDRAGIYAEFGKIICIAAGIFVPRKNEPLSIRIKAFSSHDEKEILEQFKVLINEKMDPMKLQLCAHNGKEFDFPYLCRRYLINDLSIPQALQISGKKPWEIMHMDTLEMWKFGDRKNYTSLDLLAAIFNIESSKTDMDGSMVNSVYYVDKELDKIEEYCKNDVLVTANLFLKLNQLPVITTENVYFI
jgi:DNA polymerase elongation subunit (family B)